MSISNNVFLHLQKSGINLFWNVKNSLEVLDKLHAHVGSFESVQSFDFSTVYTTLQHNLTKHKLAYIIKWSFDKSGYEYISSNSCRSFLETKNMKTA